MKKMLKCLRSIFLLVLLAILGYCLLAFLLSFFSTSPKEVQCSNQKTVFVASNGVHLDIILPIESLADEELRQMQVPQGVHFVAFGWGDQDFYVHTPTWDKMNFRTTFKALFLPSKSIMHLTFYRHAYDHWSKVELCETQLKTLLDYILTSFQASEGQFIALPGTGYTSMDLFFEARRSYSVFFTCNDWVNQGLKKAQVKTAVWSPFDFGVLYHVKN
jgi:uncharacterized protein (TIGR02117 family)